MDTLELKLLAGQVRNLLARHQHPIGHGHGLDFIAAIPGLRNWPEVIAFPGRVAEASLDRKSAERLARRIARDTPVKLDAAQLLEALQARRKAGPPLTVWPDGPPAGVYVTLDEKAAGRAIAEYDAYTNGGAQFFTDKVALEHDSAIELAEYGLFANGMRKLPSGTLIVRCPVDLAQDNWEDACGTADIACQLALYHRLRVILVMETSSPEDLYRDLYGMVRNVEYGEELVLALRGYVSEEGELVEDGSLFARARGIADRRVLAGVPPPPPANVEVAIRRAFSRGLDHGVYVLGHLSKDDVTTSMLRQALGLTEHLGAACRVEASASDMKKAREADRRLLELPSAPSVQSAIDRGYRRIFIEHFWGRAEGLLQLADKAMIVAGVRDSEAPGAVIRSVMVPSNTEPQAVHRVEAVVCTTKLPFKGEDHWIVDAYYQADQDPHAMAAMKDLFHFVLEHRSVKAEEELQQVVTALGLTREDLNSVKGEIDNRLAAGLKSIRFAKAPTAKGRA